MASDAQVQGAAAQPRQGVGAAGRGRRRYWSVEAFEGVSAAAPGVADGLHQPVGSAAVEFFVGT